MAITMTTVDVKKEEVHTITIPGEAVKEILLNYAKGQAKFNVNQEFKEVKVGIGMNSKKNTIADVVVTLFNPVQVLEG